MNIYLLIGAPGAGKSFYCKKNFSGIKIISCDELRESIFGEKRSLEIRKIIKKNIEKIITEDVLSSKIENMVIDTTYFNEASERKFFFTLGNNVNINAIFIKSTLDLCLKQNKLRQGSRVIADNMVKNLFNRVSPPSYDEGFKSIKIIDTSKIL